MDNAKYKGLVDFKEPKKAKSLIFAEAFFEEGACQDELISAVFSDTILEVYDDSNYTPSLEDVRNNTEDARMEFHQQVRSQFDTHIVKVGLEGAKLWETMDELLDRHHKGATSKADTILELANLFGFLDATSFWHGGSVREHWHSAQIESALYQIGGLQCDFADKVWNQSIEMFNLNGELLLAQIAKPIPEGPASGEIKKYAQTQIKIANEITAIKNQLVEYALKIGFLYRDNWWLEHHGEAAAEYYQRVEGLKAQQSGRKIGAKKTQDKALALREACKILIEKAAKEKGLAFACASPEIKAQTIRDIAERDNKADFEFKAGKLLSLKWFREKIEDFSASGEFVQIIEAAQDKA